MKIKTKAGFVDITDKKLRSLVNQGKIRPDSRCIQLSSGSRSVTVGEALSISVDSDLRAQQKGKKVNQNRANDNITRTSRKAAINSLDPKRGRKRIRVDRNIVGSSKNSLIAAASIAFVILASVLVFFLSGNMGSDSSIRESLSYIPSNVELIGRVDIGSLYRHPGLSSLRRQLLGELGLNEDELKREIGFSLDNITHVTFGLKKGRSGDLEPMSIVIETASPYDASRIVRFLSDIPAHKMLVAGHDVYYGGHSAGSFPQISFPSSTHILVTHSSVTESVLNRTNPVTSNRRIMDEIDPLSLSETAWAFMLIDDAWPSNLSIPIELGIVDSLLLFANFSNNVDINLTINCRNPELAQKLQEMAQMFIQMGASEMQREMGLSKLPTANVSGRKVTTSASIPFHVISDIFTATGTGTPLPPAPPPRPVSLPGTKTRVTRTGFVDDGKWREYIREPIPQNPPHELGMEIRRRIRRLLAYAQNLEGEDRNAIYRHIVDLTEAALRSESMGENWKQEFVRERNQARSHITR